MSQLSGRELARYRSRDNRLPKGQERYGPTNKRASGWTMNQPEARRFSRTLAVACSGCADDTLNRDVV